MTEVTRRMRDLIRGAREEVNRDNAPAIANAILSGMWTTVASDEDLLRHLVSRGLNQEIRMFLSRHRGDEEAEEPRDARVQQLSLWSDERAKDCIKQINRERVWVPSRGDFVELVPDALSNDELREAGEYLIQHGADCVRRGRLLVRLADLAPVDA